MIYCSASEVVIAHSLPARVERIAMAFTSGHDWRFRDNPPTPPPRVMRPRMRDRSPSLRTGTVPVSAANGFVLQLCALAFLAGDALAQKVVIGSQPTCPQCSIELVPIVRIGSSQDTISYFGEQLSISRVGSGFFVGPRWPPGEFGIDVYDFAGRRTRSLAPRGSGPGQLDLFMFAGGPGDSLILFGRQKLAVMSQDGTIRRELRPIPGDVQDAVVTERGTVVVASTVSVGGTLRALHVLDTQGLIRRSFGGLPGALGRAGYLASRRSVAPWNGDHFWAAWFNAYELELWDTEGRLIQSLVRNAEWFVPWTDTFIPERRVPGKREPMLVGIGVIGGGLLAVSVYVPRDRSMQYPSAQPLVDASEPGFFSSLYDTVIEIIDPDHGSLVATKRFDGAVRGFAGLNLVTRTIENESGVSLEVFEVRLVRP